MRSAVIDRRLLYLEQLFVDLKEIQNDIELSHDPSLKMEYEEDKKVLYEDFEDHAQDALFLLEAYIEDCKTESLPITLEYYRVYNELKKHRELKRR